MDFAASPSLEGGKETVTSLLPRRRRLPERLLRHSSEALAEPRLGHLPGRS